MLPHAVRGEDEEELLVRVGVRVGVRVRVRVRVRREEELLELRVGAQLVVAHGGRAHLLRVRATARVRLRVTLRVTARARVRVTIRVRVPSSW